MRTLKADVTVGYSEVILHLCSEHKVVGASRVLCVAILWILLEQHFLGKRRIIGQDLAEMMGRDKSSINKVLRIMERMGVIQRSGKLGPTGRPIHVRFDILSSFNSE